MPRKACGRKTKIVRKNRDKLHDNSKLGVEETQPKSSKKQEETMTASCAYENSKELINVNQIQTSQKEVDGDTQITEEDLMKPQEEVDLVEPCSSGRMLTECSSSIRNCLQTLKVKDLPPPHPLRSPSPPEPPFSVQETNRSKVQPFTCNNSLSISIHLEKTFDEHNEESTQIRHGEMNDGERVVIKRRPISAMSSSRLENEILSKMNHPGIVSFRCYSADERFTYLVLQNVETSLEGYLKCLNSTMAIKDEKKVYLQTVLMKVLQGLNFLQKNGYLHGAIKPQHVRVDEAGEPKWIDFTSSVKVAGCDGSRRTDELCKTGQLVYYILSGGENYCGRNTSWSVSDLEWDLVKWMSKEESSLEKALAHPLFWNNYRKLKYLEALDNIQGIQYYKPSRNSKKFHTWKATLSTHSPKLVEEMEERTVYAEHVLGLLHFIRNVLQHRAEEEVDFISIFPDLFQLVYIWARDMNLNSKASVKRILFDWSR